MRESNESGFEGLKMLTEAEIQERLYGQYLGRRKKPQTLIYSPPSVTTKVTKESPEWTGAEILSGELSTLRKDLMTLRKERDRLAEELRRRQQQLVVWPDPGAVDLPRRSAPLPPGADVPVVIGTVPHSQDSSDASAWGRLGGLALLVMMLGAIGIPVGNRFLQASPVVGEVSPFTVQVAVYDSQLKAGEALARLKELGYSAFLVSSPRRDGRVRYRIYVGQYVTQEEARQEQLRLAGDPRLSHYGDAFVRIQ